jgi:gliding motility-associated-like protein
MLNSSAKIKILLLLLVVAFYYTPETIYATHQRAAELTYKHISGLTYEITLVTYTRTGMPANTFRNTLPVNWGDGYSDDVPRVDSFPLPSDPNYGVTFNKYVWQHTYHGPGTFVISMEDPNRNADILNIPNSVNIPLYIYSELVINPFLGYVDSPQLLIPPIDNGCVNEPFFHNPGAYSPDGDSLSYRLVPCLGAGGLTIPGYSLPPTSSPNILHLDSVTGDFSWENPPNQGQYNIAILIEAWRNGNKIGSVERDMQIIIVACDNRPPVIDPVDDTCVEAGDTLVFKVHAHDPDGDIVKLTGTGGPLVMTSNRATLSPNPAVGHDSVTTTFTWKTVCDHVQRLPYRVYFKATDNSTPVNLADIQSMQITVIGPPPENLTATALGTSITLTWDKYPCLNAKGFYIFRKADSSGYIPGYCQTGVPPYLGFVKIGEITDSSQTTYVDNNSGAGLNLGYKYCYLIDAYYPDDAESYASNEACASLKKDIPVLTNVSVNSTSETNGSIYLAWSKPTEIDTILAPGPYRYIIERANPANPGQFTPIDSTTDLNDSIYTDTMLNTKLFPYKYRIGFYNIAAGHYFLIGYSQAASSVYLTITATDKRLKLSWNTNVPWSNYRYTIYRKDLLTSIFDSIGTSDQPSYDDKGLINGTEYCYHVKSTGKYSSSGFIDPIINYSQNNCSIPVDNIPPCPPVLRISTDCEKVTNRLSWPIISDTCSLDITLYYIYFSPTENGDPVLLDSTLNLYDTVYLHKQNNSVVGCYRVIAKDSAGNKSDYSNRVCVDDICSYRLPNVFTPNGTGGNDYFVPFPHFADVEKINLTIFNRWGKKVFETHDPAINWDGKDQTTNQPCSDGTYFYICDVYQITLSGTVKRTIRGSVTILR